MADKTGSPGRRKVLLINPGFQLTFIGFNLGLAAIAIALLYLENNGVFSQLTGTNIPKLQQDPILQELVDSDRSTMNLWLGITGLIIFFIMTVGGLIMSHRIAGPIYRMQKHMEAHARGDTDSDVKFREKDFFPELAAAFNDMMAKRYRKK